METAVWSDWRVSGRCWTDVNICVSLVTKTCDLWFCPVLCLDYVLSLYETAPRFSWRRTEICFFMHLPAVMWCPLSWTCIALAWPNKWTNCKWTRAYKQVTCHPIRLEILAARALKTNPIPVTVTSAKRSGLACALWCNLPSLVFISGVSTLRNSWISVSVQIAVSLQWSTEEFHPSLTWFAITSFC